MLGLLTMIFAAIVVVVLIFYYGTGYFQRRNDQRLKENKPPENDVVTEDYTSMSTLDQDRIDRLTPEEARKLLEAMEKNKDIPAHHDYFRIKRIAEGKDPSG